MERYTKELGIDGASQHDVSCVTILSRDTNGQTKIISTTLLEKNGGNSVQHAIENMIKRNSVDQKRGIKEYLYSVMMLWLNGLKSMLRGTRGLRKEEKSDVADAPMYSFPQRGHLNSVQSPVHPKETRMEVKNRIIKELVYLLENKLISL